MFSFRNTRAKVIVVICLILIAACLTWEVHRMSEKASSPVPSAAPAAPVLPPMEQPLPINREAPPAPPVEIPKKVPAAPASKPKKIVVSKKLAPRPVVTPPVQLPVRVPVIVPPAPPPPEPTGWQGNDTAVTHSGQVVIRNDNQWISFWGEHHPHEAAPDVDFTQKMVLGVFAGSRPADQFSIAIIAVRSAPGTLIVDYRETPPPTGTFAVNVTAYPYDIKVVPRSTLPVKFNRLVDNSGKGSLGTSSPPTQGGCHGYHDMQRTRRQ
jgi:hypothetical protein